MAKTKIPKQVAGVKVPKKIRKKGDKLIAAAEQHPILAELAASALLAAAAALRDGGKRRVIKDEAEAFATKVKSDGAELKAAIKAATSDALRQLSETLAGSAEAIRSEPAPLVKPPKPPKAPKPPKSRKKAK